jgi:uncharacterized protein Yka (UPF0111/DUF47 family)
VLVLPVTLQGLIRFLLPREDHFYDYLERQAAAAHLGARALARLKEPDATVQQVREAVQAHEHEGDKVVHEMEEALAKTFVTPIDREDLQRLSAQLDDVLDLANGTARACVLYGVARPTEPMVKLMDLLERCTALLETAMPRLRKHEYTELLEASRGMRDLEKEADGVFRGAISALFHDESIDARRVLREKEVLEDLENAIDQCELVAETLVNLSVKHG